MARRGVQLTLAAALTSVGIAASIGLVAGAAASGVTNNRAAQVSRSARLSATLNGFEQVPSLNSPGHASFRATMTPDQIRFRLTYANLSTPLQAAHIHVGQRGVNGGVAAFLCGGGGKPSCPKTTSGRVSGTITAADVVGPTAQGFTAGDLASLERAISAGVTYVNMHTTKFPDGEIRGQIRAG
jgi:hypothetical protein